MRVSIALLCALLALANVVAGTLTVSNTIGSNMVLQRAPAQATIWGWTTASNTVTVTFNNNNIQATVSSDGSFIAQLPATNAGGPYTIEVATSAGDKVGFENIMFGDVWLCGGQSNMQFTVASAFNATAEIAAANNYPNIRVFTVGQTHYSSTPLTQLAGIAQGWSVASAATVGAGNWSEFSAVCWFTGRDLYDRFQVPIGLISSNWGGTVIQAWSSPTALKECNVTASGSGQEANSVLYNAMIIPFQKQPILGVLWYQGEQNVGQAPLYACMFPAMIKDWRANFPGQNLVFLFVQLAPWITTADVQDQRAAQLAALTVPSVGFASAVDLGDPTAPYGSVHPRAKQPVGWRLSLAAAALAYKQNVVWESPTYSTSAVSVSSTTVTVTVVFNLWGSGGLVATNTMCAPGVPAAICANWVLILSNGTSVTATQTSVAGATVKLQASNINPSVSVTTIQYAYAPWPVTTVFSQEGLPAIPFSVSVN